MKLRFLNTVPKTKDDYKKHLLKFVKDDIKDPAYLKRIIHGLINSVWVADGGIFVFYNTDNEKPLTLDDVKETLKKHHIDYDALCRSDIGGCGSNIKHDGGQGWIRTIEDVSRRIYSPQHLTALQPTQICQAYTIKNLMSIFKQQRDVIRFRR